MNCRVAEEQYTFYLLGALDSQQMSRMDRHLDSCGECGPKLREEGELATLLAYSVPQLKAPERVKSRLLASIHVDADSAPFAKAIRSWPEILSRLGRTLVTHTGLAAGLTLVAVVILGGVWFNGRLNSVADEKQILANQLESVVQVELEMKEIVERQRYLLLMAADPGVSVNLLSGTEWSPDSTGMILTPETGKGAVLAVLNLPPLESRDYEVWLVKDGVMHIAGSFTVDSTGYGQTNITITAPISDFDAIVIATKREFSVPEPAEVLKGDL